MLTITCDGPACNFSMIKYLGVKINFPEINCHFKHPSDDKSKMCVIFDACHMLKLIRNTLHDYKNLVNEEGETISWTFLKERFELQSKEGLHFG